MKCGDLIEKLEESFPLSYAAGWDNPGLMAGRREKEVKRVYIGLDATDEVIRDAKEKGADMLLTHHPLLFSPVRKVNTDDFTGRRLVELIQSDISCYAMHTNYDVAMMAPLASRMLGLRDEEVLDITCTNEVTGEPEGFGRTGWLPAPVTLKECCELVKKVFGLEHVILYGDEEKVVSRAAVSPGSGKSMVQPAIWTGAEVLISGDFGHHEGIDSMMQGLAVIDAGHYGLEHIFISQMEEYMKKNHPDLEVYLEPVRNPFRIL
ncbi:Nif3-like dinuclear metal center hexameric protein [Murimonas intestini]|uniref:Nif3-like dinuclear metal center hexameric protein n=1 Tax=Murimonas intestini TaxID=1337051 RepID=UPI0011DCC47D|nr:Nif3-like dinuclear metal center hexameric protein [Murimonas intestini]